jgi:hypothetical protein
MRTVLAHVWSTFPEPEAIFWGDLARKLEERGITLFLTGPNAPPPALERRYLRVAFDLRLVGDVVRRADPQVARARLWKRGNLDLEELLASGAAWIGRSLGSSEKAELEAAFNYYAAIYTQCLARWRPERVAVWNGHYTPQVILTAMAEVAGCKISFIERGPFPGTLYCDARGILGDGSVTTMSRLDLGTEAALGMQALRTLQERVAKTQATWWGQASAIGPEALRKRLGIPANKRILLFAEQLEADAQSFKYSPIFATPRDAFAWLNEQLSSREDVFLLGKAHPLSTRRPEEWRSLFRVPGLWAGNINIFDALAVASHVVAVNSTMLYEAMLESKPTLALGRGLFSGRHFFYEVDTKNDHERVDSWLESQDLRERIARFEQFAAYMLRRHLYAYGIECGDDYAGLGAVDLAREWASAKMSDRHTGESDPVTEDMEGTGNAVLRLAAALPGNELRHREEMTDWRRLTWLLLRAMRNGLRGAHRRFRAFGNP